MFPLIQQGKDQHWLWDEGWSCPFLLEELDEAIAEKDLCLQSPRWVRVLPPYTWYSAVVGLSLLYLCALQQCVILTQACDNAVNCIIKRQYELQFNKFVMMAFTGISQATTSIKFKCTSTGYNKWRYIAQHVLPRSGGAFCLWPGKNCIIRLFLYFNSAIEIITCWHMCFVVPVLLSFPQIGFWSTFWDFNSSLSLIFLQKAKMLLC